MERFNVPVTSSKFDLAVFVAEEQDALAGYWVYSADLFERATIAEMCRRYEALLQELVLNPDTPLHRSAQCASTGKRPQDGDQANRLNHHKTPLEDTRSLAWAGQEVTADYVAPQTPTEEAIAEVWCEVLGPERIGLDENLFEVGGHSLIATQIAARLRSRFGLAIHMRTLFNHPTVRELPA